MTDDRATLLVADIGGTKTDIALFREEPGLQTPVALETYRNSDHGCPEEVLDRFVKRRGLRNVDCCIAVAGPVAGEEARLTNGAWTVRSGELSRRFGFRRCVLVNDLYALGVLIPHLSGDDLGVLKQGTPSAHGTKAVIAPGTGLGHSFLVWDGSGYRAYPSEGGHAGFAPADALETALLAHLRKQLGRVVVEDVCSGSGLPRIYGFLNESGVSEGTGEAEGEPCGLSTSESIVAHSREPGKRLVCQESVRLFCAVLVAEARNTALQFLASGGVYIAGNLSLCLMQEIRAAFAAGRFVAHDRTGALTEVPVYLVLDHHPVIRGAYWVSRDRFALGSLAAP